MRSLAIVITAFLLTTCTVDPKVRVDGKGELAKLEGPKVDSISKLLLSQAQDAENKGEFKRAAQTYKQLMDQSPDNNEYIILEADNLRRSGSNDLALKSIEKALKKEPKNAQALEVKGLSLMNMGEFAEAGKVFDQVMKIDTRRWRTLNAIAIMFAIKKMNTEAIEYYNAALKVNPDSPGILNNLGLSLAMEKDYTGAVDKFTTAKNRLSADSPEIERIDLNLALVYAISGRLEEAEQTAAPHLSKAGLYNNMGFYAYLNKNKELAKSYLNMALTQNPVYYDRAWKNLGAVTGENASESNAQTDEEREQAGKTEEKRTALRKGKVDPRTEDFETKPKEKAEAPASSKPPVKAEIKPVEITPAEPLEPTKVYPPAAAKEATKVEDKPVLPAVKAVDTKKEEKQPEKDVLEKPKDDFPFTAPDISKIKP